MGLWTHDQTLPKPGWEGFGGFEKRRGFIELKDIARLEVKPVADMVIWPLEVWLACMEQPEASVGE